MDNADKKTKTISFEQIKKRATQLAIDNFMAWGGPWLAREDGLGAGYGLDISMGTLLPAMQEAIASGRSMTAVHKEVVDDVIARCKSIIAHWDVRQVNRLVDLFPEAVPASCRLRNAVCEYDDKGEWVVTFDLSRRRSSVAAPSGAEEIAFNHLCGSGGRLKALLPQVTVANEAYQAAWARFSADPRANGATDAIRAATSAFNAVLGRAIHAFYLDTHSYNHWDTLRQAWGPDRHGKDDMALWFVGAHDAVHVVEKLTKMAADLQAGVFEQSMKEQAAETIAQAGSQRSQEADRDRDRDRRPAPRG